MPLAGRVVLAVALAVKLVACGDHYEGGGRRRELPTSDQPETPGIGPGDGSSTSGGAPASQAGVGEAGFAGGQ
jgi:hypothetical protein